MDARPSPVYTLAGQDAAARTALQRLERSLRATAQVEAAGAADHGGMDVDVVAEAEAEAAPGEGEDDVFPPRGLLGPTADMLSACVRACVGGCLLILMFCACP